LKVDLRDKEVLDAIRPSDFIAYLRFRGWREHPQPASTWIAFTLQDFEITLPLTSNLRDFALRMGEALRTLEVAEERSQLEILSELTRTTY